MWSYNFTALYLSCGVTILHHFTCHVELQFNSTLLVMWSYNSTALYLSRVELQFYSTLLVMWSYNFTALYLSCGVFYSQS